MIRLAYLLMFLIVACTNIRAQDDDKQKASPWFARENIRLVERIKTEKEREAKLKQSLEETRQIKATAEKLNEPRSVAVAQQAIDLGEGELKRLQAELARDIEAQKAFQQATSWKLAGKTVAVPARMSGQVMKDTAHGPVPLDASAPILIGDTIRTGNGALLEVYFEDGTSVFVNENSVFNFAEQTLKRSLYKLINGGFHVRRYSSNSVLGMGKNYEIQYHTPTAVAAVRGTEFEISLDENGFTHLKPASGTIELTAAKDIDLKRLPRWWEKEAAPITLEDGTRISKPANSETGIEKDEAGRLVNVLRRGHFHIVRSDTNGTNARSKFSAGNAILTMSAGEFDVSVDNGVVDILPIRGSITVADKQKHEEQR